MRSVTFRGGVHPDYEKEPVASRAIRESTVPERIVIQMTQHVGAPCRPVVKKGDRVKMGQLVGEAVGFVSAPVHSSVSGLVISVDRAPHPLGMELPSIIVEPDGKNDCEFMEPIQNPLDEEPKILRERVRAGGLVGMGGAAFPTHVKLSPPPDKPIDTVLFNGTECEPYLTADDRVMREEPHRVLKGMQVAAHIMGLRGGIICIETNKPEAIEAISKECDSFPGFRVQPLEVKYPQGGEKQLIQAVLGREVPSGGLPMDCGVMVFNVNTCGAICDAVYEGRPLITRVTTVTGHGVESPANFHVRLGTPVSHLLDQCGGFSQEPGKVILGGPMMGVAIHDLSVPVLKSVGGVLVQPRDEVLDQNYGPCIRCGNCVRACPMRLVPNELGNYAEKRLWEEAEARDLMDCMECGCCTYVCPASRPLIHLIRTARAKVHEKRSKK